MYRMRFLKMLLIFLAALLKLVSTGEQVFLHGQTYWKHFAQQTVGERYLALIIFWAFKIFIRKMVLWIRVMGKFQVDIVLIT